MSKPRAGCGPFEGYVRPSLDFPYSKISYTLTTCPYFINLESDIFDAADFQCHFTTSVTISVRIRTRSVH